MAKSKYANTAAVDAALDKARTSVQLFSRNLVSVIGNSIGVACAPFTSATDAIALNDNSTLHNLARLSGYSAVPHTVRATGGLRSDQIIAAHLYQIISDAPNHVICYLFENDITASITADEMISNASTLITACVANGIVPWIVTTLPSYSFTTTAHANKYWEVSSRLKALCHSRGVICIDGFSAYGDYSNPYPQPLAGYTDASVHPHIFGALKITQTLLLPTWRRIYGGEYVPAMTIAGNMSAFSNPRLSGTTGTPINGGTGTVPTGYYWNAPASYSSAVSSIVAGTDSALPWWQVAVDTSANADLEASQFAEISVGSSAIGVGENVYLQCEMDIVAESGYRTSQIYVQYAGGSPISLYYANDTRSVPGNNPVAFRGLFKTEAHTIPTGTTTIRIFAKHMALAGSAIKYTAKIRNFGLFKAF